MCLSPYYHRGGRGGQGGLKRLLVLVLLVIFLPGCQTPPPAPVYPELSFTDKSVIRFNVGSIEVISGYVSSGTAPNVEREFPYTPEETLWQWAEDRLRAVSGRGAAKITIREASIQRDDLETDAGFLGLFKREQSERYTAKLEVSIDVYDGSRTGSATIEVTRSHTFPEGKSLNQRDQARYDFLKNLMDDFNSEAERAIASQLGGFLAPDNV